MLSSGKQVLRLLNRRSRNGQAILIVAFAFMALIAFVGIAVDVALLFVRYSSLTRAVDAAAIAAAGQIREGTDYLTLQAVAQQFVKLQGNVNPDTVRVETCETEVYDYIQAHPGATSAQALDALINPTPPQRPSELCKKDPQKLVRVSAQLNSPTTFLALLGWPNVLLEASAVSQTAVLDVALVIDVSWSQAYDTYYAETTSTDIHDPVEYPVQSGQTTNETALASFREFMDPLNMQPYVDGVVGLDGVNASGQAAIRPECAQDRTTMDGGVRESSTGYAANYAWAGCCNDPSSQTNPPLSPSDPGTTDPGRVVDAPNNTYSYNPDGTPLLTNPPIPGYNPDWYIYDAPGLSEAEIQATGTNTHTGKTSSRVVNGKPDGNYSDLLCRPFKDVRDAARRFIKRLDFVRGDRLVLVTFGGDPHQIFPSGQSVPVITDKDTAIRTLNEKVGVEVNPSGLQHDCLTTQRYTPTNWVNWRAINSYWTVSQCRDTNTGGGIRMARASLTNPDWIRRDSVWVMVLLSDGYPNRTPSYTSLGSEFPIAGPESDSLTVMPAERPNDLTGELPRNPETGAPTTIDDWCGSPADPSIDWSSPTTGKLATLGMKPQLCVPPIYTGGKNWGNYSSDSSGANQAIWSFGFCPWYTFCNSDATHADPLINPVLPQCPTGYAKKPSMWFASDPRTAGTQFDPAIAYPFCIDSNPDTRHFCSDANGIINSPNAYCDEQYDPDDYARDQADFAGLSDYTSKTKGSFIAMFGIFFAHNVGTNNYINDNILGVKFLRYLADAGDNGAIDNRLQMWYRAKHEIQVDDPNTRMSSPLGGWFTTAYKDGVLPASTDARFLLPGVIDNPTEPQKDPCAAYDYREAPGQPGPSDPVYEDLAKHDCGQFWFASNITKVNDAFTEIAGRLFTRLSR